MSCECVCERESEMRERAYMCSENNLNQFSLRAIAAKGIIV